MITLRRSADRRHLQRRRQEAWYTFFPDDPELALANGFAGLQSFDEDRVPPRASSLQRPQSEGESVTYVREGAIVYESSLGRSGVLHAGEFQRTHFGAGMRQGEWNALREHWASVFHIGLSSLETRSDLGEDQRRFSNAERCGKLCVVASPDARSGSLRVQEDVSMYSALLEPGRHLVHELAKGRCAWLHLMQGEVTLGDVALGTGDGAGIAAERSVSFTARAESEVFLIDLCDPDPSVVGERGRS